MKLTLTNKKEIKALAKLFKNNFDASKLATELAATDAPKPYRNSVLGVVLNTEVVSATGECYTLVQQYEEELALFIANCVIKRLAAKRAILED